MVCRAINRGLSLFFGLSEIEVGHDPFSSGSRCFNVYASANRFLGGIGFEVVPRCPMSLAQVVVVGASYVLSSTVVFSLSTRCDSPPARPIRAVVCEF